jgi:D-alanyl-lipoteichoic acid acyltransferase DltB (MBOAT superfamily)
MLLLLASCYFYMAFIPIFILILLFTIMLDYSMGILMENSNVRKKRLFLIISLLGNIGILCFFKYYNFFIDNINVILQAFDLPEYSLEKLGIILPIGLSIHTFQSISYSVEVYRGNQKAERHLGLFSLYVMFYPQLLAGPIERPQNLLPQLKREHHYDFENIKSGLMQMAFGFFKKVVIADRLAIYVNNAYADIDHQNSTSMVIASFFFTFQVYCDFSGYSDIAIGAARVMGIRLMQNFNAPYLAKTIKEFWQKWNISLTTWFRDYIYLPLGGSKNGPFRTNMNIMIIFLISGLWHGANWTFIAWGALNGLFLILAPYKDRLLIKYQSPPWIQRIITFSLISISLVFFRANSFSDTFLIFKQIFSLNFTFHIPQYLNSAEMLFSCLLIASLIFKEYYFLTVSTINTKRFYIQFSLLMVVCYFFGIFNSDQFLYFQF